MHERDIFISALEKGNPAERSAYVERACGGDPSVRQRIEALLKESDALGSFLESPAATVDQVGVAEAPGTVIGPYKLLQQIGEGGMGSVFMAEQSQPVQRKVAIKIIKAGMDSRQVIARFEAERQALALMDHPNIAKVLDAGTIPDRSRLAPPDADFLAGQEVYAGRPYFVMELVKGIPITKYCDEHHLTPRRRLELFVPVCQAVQHAHTKGIIHRDLKPSNVLVAEYDDKPVVKVIDFGVAKATGSKLTERTVFTELGQIVGTLEYMSPEQAKLNALDIDTRSDVYALGVLIYELLTGTTPFERKRLKQAAFDEMLRIIREEEAPKPSTRLSTTEELPSIAANRSSEPKKLSALVRGELDWIVMKCLEKDRDRRYETANGLAHDIERYLHDEPVQACPPSAWYRLRKLVRRNKGPMLAAGLLLLALIAGIIGTSWGLVRAESARQDAVEAQRAEEQRAEGERLAKHEAQAREAETKAVLDFVENKILAAARPEDQEGGQGIDVKLADAVAAALPFVDTSFSRQPLIEARLRTTLGLSFLYLGNAPTATAQFAAARALFVQNRGADHPDTLTSMGNLANGYFSLGRHTEALKLHRETLALRKAKLGPDHPDTLASMNDLSASYDALARHAEALELREETLRLQKAKLGPDHPETLGSMYNLALSYNALGRHAEALKLHDETLALRKARLGPNHPDTLLSMTELANSYTALGRHVEALKLREETLELQKAELGPDHFHTLSSMSNLANSYDELGRHADALRVREETLTRRKAKLGPDHPHTLMSMGNLAVSYTALGRHAEALKLFEETLTLRKAKLGPGHRDTLTNMFNLANIYAEFGRHADALRLHEETLGLRKVKLGADHPDTLLSMWLVAANLETLDRGAEALPIVDECLRLVAGKVVHPALLPGLMGVRLRLCAKNNDAAGCRATAEMWEDQKLADAYSLYNAACFRAVTARVIRAGDEEDAAKVAAAEADQAMAWLKRAAAAGFKDAAHIKKDTELDALRDRADFQQLLAELEGGQE
jgi:serine/threonine protein kinase